MSIIVRRRDTKYYLNGTGPLKSLTSFTHRVCHYAGIVWRMKESYSISSGLAIRFRPSGFRSNTGYYYYCIPDDVATFLLHLAPLSLKQYKRYLWIHLLNCAKACIPAYWKQTSAPPIKLGFHKNTKIKLMEELMKKKRKKQEGTWGFRMCCGSYLQFKWCLTGTLRQALALLTIWRLAPWKHEGIPLLHYGSEYEQKVT